MRDVGARDAQVIEIDFGLVPTTLKTVTITDARVTPTTSVFMDPSGIAATGRQADENEMDTFVCRCTPGTGTFTAYLDSLFGKVVGKYKFEYVVR